MKGRSCLSLSGTLLGCVLLCCGDVFCLCALFGFPPALPCRSGLFLCCGVPPCSVFPGSFCCCVAVVRCPVSCPGQVSFGVALAYPVALLLVCCAVPPCVVFGGASHAVLWCAVLACLLCVALCCVLLSFGCWLVPGVDACFLGPGGGPRCPLPSSGGARGPLPFHSAPWRGSLRRPVPRCCVLGCCPAVWCCAFGFSVLLPLLLVFGFALYCKNHCKIQNKTTFPLFFKRRLDTTQHAHVGRKQNLCNSGLTYMLPAVLNGIVVVDVKFARG